MDLADEKRSNDEPREKEKKKKKKSKPKTEEDVLAPNVAEADTKPDGEKKEKKVKKKKSSRPPNEDDQALNGNAAIPSPVPVEPSPKLKPASSAAGEAGKPPSTPSLEDSQEMVAQQKKLEEARLREEARRKEEKERRRRERKLQKEAEERRQREEEEEARRLAAQKEAGSKPGRNNDDDDYGDDFENYSDEFEDDEGQAKVLKPSSEKKGIAAPSPVLTGASRKQTAGVIKQTNEDLAKMKEALALENAAAKERSLNKPPMAKPTKGTFTVIPTNISAVQERPLTSGGLMTDRPGTSSTRPGSSSTRTQKYQNSDVAKGLAKFSKKGYRAKRVQDLLSLVSLEQEKAVVINQMPIPLYEMYVRKLRGAAGVIKQIANQSNEDDRAVEVQTEEIETKEQEVQFSLGDDTTFENILKALKDKKSIDQFKKTGAGSQTGSSLRLMSFLQGASQLCEAVCEKNIAEQKKFLTEEQETKDENSMFVAASDWTSLGQARRLSNSSPSRDLLARVLFNREVTGLVFSRIQPNMVCSSYMTRRSSDDPLQDYGVLCMWDTLSSTKPSRFCFSHAGLTCCTLGLLHPYVIIGGTIDGQILLWDLRESKREQQAQNLELQKLADKLCSEGVVRSTTYTSSSLHPSTHAHTSKIISVAQIPVENMSRGADSSRAGFQVASLDDRGLLVLWLVNDNEKVEPGGSAQDLGLSISGRIRLVLSRTMWVDPTHPENPLENSIDARSPTKGLASTSTGFKSPKKGREQLDFSQSPGPTVQAVSFYPKEPSRFIAALSNGSLIQRSRFGSCPPPKIFQGPFSFGEHGADPVAITCMDFSILLPDYFLAGCKDGSVRLYSIFESSPLMHWVADCFVMDSTPKNIFSLPSVTAVHWSSHRASVFYVVISTGLIFVFDLLKQQNGPIFSEKHDRCVGAESEFPNLLSVSQEKVNIGKPRMIVSCGSTVSWRYIARHLVTPPRDLNWEKEQLKNILSSALL